MGYGRIRSIRAPFLKEVELLSEKVASFDIFPFCIPAIRECEMRIEFSERVTIFVGENGTWKSTILEAIAGWCGFNLTGGNKNHAIFSRESEILSDAMRFSWLPKVSDGFFFRAETFYSFIASLDRLGRQTGENTYDAYGGENLNLFSHAESFFQLFENQFWRTGIYILDEPESALSPERQLDFLRIIKAMDDSWKCQIIMATHSPLLMAYPWARLLQIGKRGIIESDFRETSHFATLKEFFDSPEDFVAKNLEKD